MVTRIKVIFVICLFAISGLLSEFLLGEGGYFDSLNLKENVAALKEYEEKKREELAFLRESSQSATSSLAVESSLVLSFEEDEAYVPEVNGTTVVGSGFKPISKLGSAFIGLCVSILYLAVAFVVEKFKDRKTKDESKNN